LKVIKSIMTLLCQKYCKAFNVTEVILLSGDVKTSARPFTFRWVKVITYLCMSVINRILGFTWECVFVDDSKLVLSTHPKIRDSGNKLVLSAMLGPYDLCTLTLPTHQVGWKLLECSK